MSDRSCTAGANLSMALVIMVAGIYCAGAGCGKSILPGKRIEDEFSQIAADLRRGVSKTDILREKRMGGSGYFYLIDMDGRVVYHPQSALIGLVFRDNALVKFMLKEKSGCVRQEAEGVSRVIIFRPVGGEQVLCLSIPPDEVDLNSMECGAFK